MDGARRGFVVKCDDDVTLEQAGPLRRAAVFQGDYENAAFVWRS